MHKHLIHKRPSRLLFMMCWIVYGSSYIGRINFSAALTMMVRDGGIPKQEALPMLVTSGVLVTLLPAMLHGMIKEGVNIWVPTMLNELYSIGAVFSLFLSMFLPLISIIGPYIITFLYFKCCTGMKSWRRCRFCPHCLH